MLTRKLPPLLLELCLDGFQVRLSSLQASYLLSKVRRMAAGTLVWRRELKGIVDAVVAVDAEALARWRVVVDVVGVMLRAVPQKDFKEGAQRGDVSPRRAGEDGASRLMRCCSRSSWKDAAAFWISNGRSER